MDYFSRAFLCPRERGGYAGEESRKFATNWESLGKPGERKAGGQWQLVSGVARQPDGTVKHTMGADPIGLLIYDSFGNMSVQIMDSFRPGFERGYARTTLEELKSVYDGYLAYFGTYVIDEKQHAVVHRIKAITNPNYYGAGLVRYYELSGDRLVLSLDKDKMNSLT